MRLARFATDGRPRTGVVKADGIIDLHRAIPDLVAVAPPGDMAALLALGQAGMDRIRTAVANTDDDDRVPLARTHLLAPIANPPKIICCWLNYVNPAVPKLPETPMFFSKYSSAIIGSGDAIQLPRVGDQVIVEPEMTAVIGIGGRDLTPDVALTHVAGYTITNDITAFSHRLQNFLGSPGPYMMAKTFDTFAPMGPWLVTSDDVPDPHGLTVRQWLNDELQLASHTSKAVFKLPEIISYLSNFFTFQPGDIILTGSPPPIGELRYLTQGDVVRIEIERLGVLENPVVAAVAPTRL